MFIEEKLEAKIQRTEKKLQELSIHLERIEREYQKVLKQIDLTPEQLIDFGDKPENFSSQVWEQVQNEKKESQKKLETQLANICNANKTKKTFSERGTIQQHWLFVR